MENIRKILQESDVVFERPDILYADGFTQVPNAILNNPNLSLGEVVTYSKLLQYAWEKTTTSPAQERIVAETSMGLTSVKTYLKGLKDKNFISIHRRGQGLTNKYTLRYLVDKSPKKSL